MVTVQIRSAPSTACWALATACTGRPVSLDSRSAKASALPAGRLKTRTRRTGRTASMACRWVWACVPAPMMARSEALGRASRSVATPLTAAVRMAVIEVASTMARSRPRSVSKTSTTPWWVSYSLPKLAGKAAITLTPTDSRPPRYEGIRPSTRSPPGSASMLRSGSKTSPPASMTSVRRITSMASLMGKSLVTWSWSAMSTFMGETSSSLARSLIVVDGPVAARRLDESRRCRPGERRHGERRLAARRPLADV